MKGLKKCLFYLIVFCSSGYACTDFLIRSEEGNIVIGRSMEFGTFLDSEIIFFPKGLKTTSMLEGKTKGLSWTNKYSYLAVNAFGMDMVVDGMNEKGLSFGILWFPGAKYPSNSSNNTKKTIALEDLGNWILGTFSNVREVAKGLKTISILAQVIPKLNEVPPIHLSIHDKKGTSLTIEFLDGEMKVLDNPVGVLTNAPKLEWHLINLRNYVNLSAFNKDAVTFDGSLFAPTGQGTGLLGIPGDWTPPSRFVKTAILKNFAEKAKNTSENINLAFHLLNTVDIPYGVVRGANSNDYDYTQWVVVKDLNHQKLYYRTYRDLNIYSIYLRNEKGTSKKKFPMQSTND